VQKNDDFELRRRLLQMEMLYEIGVELNKSLDPTLVADEILQRALIMVDARGAALLVRDEEDGCFRIVEHVGREGDPTEILGLPELIQAWDDVDIKALERQTERWRHLCILPLHSHEQVGGLLVVGDREEREGVIGPFSESDQALLQSFAYQAGSALHNARLHRDLRLAYEDLQRVQNKLAQMEQLRALGDLSAEVAHSMGHILGIVMGRADMYLHFREDPEQAMKSILEAAEQGRQVIQRIQQATRLGVAKKRENLNVRNLLQETVNEVQTLWEKERVNGSVEWTVEVGEIPEISLNGSDFKEALRNIFINALEAMPDGGAISVVAARRDEQIELKIGDTGSGMNAETCRRLFEPFFTTKEKVGNGLGMSIVYRIVEDHGGHIEVESEEGKGTLFTVSLPIRVIPVDV